MCFKNSKIQYNINAATVGAINVNSFLSLSVGGSIRKNRKKKQKSYKNHHAVREITRGANPQKYDRSILAQIFLCQGMRIWRIWFKFIILKDQLS